VIAGYSVADGGNRWEVTFEIGGAMLGVSRSFWVAIRGSQPYIETIRLDEERWRYPVALRHGDFLTFK
jgi:hypothetical protein